MYKRIKKKKKTTRHYRYCCVRRVFIRFFVRVFPRVSLCISGRIFFCNPFVLFSPDAVCAVYRRLRTPSKCARGPQTVDDAYNRDKHNGPDDRGHRFPRNEHGLLFAMLAKTRRKIPLPPFRSSSPIALWCTDRVPKNKKNTR